MGCGCVQFGLVGHAAHPQATPPVSTAKPMLRKAVSQDFAGKAKAKRATTPSAKKASTPGLQAASKPPMPDEAEPLHGGLLHLASDLSEMYDRQHEVQAPRRETGLTMEGLERLVFKVCGLRLDHQSVGFASGYSRSLDS